MNHFEVSINVVFVMQNNRHFTPRKQFKFVLRLLFCSTMPVAKIAQEDVRELFLKRVV